MINQIIPSIIGISGKKGNGKDEVCKMIQNITANPDFTSQDYVQMGEFFEVNPFIITRVGWEKKQFAGKLKQIVALLIGCNIEDLENNDFKNKPLGEEWRRWSVYNYKLKGVTDPNGKISPYFQTEKEASEYIVKFKGVNDGDFPWFSSDNIYIGNEVLTPRIMLQQIGTEGLRDLIHPDIHVNALFADYKSLKTGSRVVKSFEGIPVDYYIYEELPKWIIPDTRFENEAKAIKDRNGLILRVNNPRVVSTDTHPSETSLDSYQFDYVIENDGTLEELYDKVRNFCDQFNLI